jgi:polyisoprenoid-binding protein YceI
MKRIILLLAISFLFIEASAQKYMTRTGYISFYSHTPIVDIKADNNQVASVLDISTGEIVFQVLIKSFHFEKTLMEEHFNENYMESEKFPKSTFSGKILNLSSVDFTKNGKYDVTVEGDLNIHNVTNKVTAKGVIEIIAGGINATSKFNIVPEDYKITIPGIVRENIARNLEVTVKMNYLPLEKQ